MKSIKPIRHQIPWLVGYADFRRYRYRALHHCAHARCIFFYATMRTGGQCGRRVLFGLAPIKSYPAIFELSTRDFRAGRYRKVRLADPPPLRRK